MITSSTIELLFGKVALIPNYANIFGNKFKVNIKIKFFNLYFCE